MNLGACTEIKVRCADFMDPTAELPVIIAATILIKTFQKDSARIRFSLKGWKSLTVNHFNFSMENLAN